MTFSMKKAVLVSSMMVGLGHGLPQTPQGASATLQIKGFGDVPLTMLTKRSYMSTQVKPDSTIITGSAIPATIKIGGQSITSDVLFGETQGPVTFHVSEYTRGKWHVATFHHSGSRLMTKVPVRDAEGSPTVCLDKSPAMMYISLPPGSEGSLVQNVPVVEIKEGGRFCSNKAECARAKPERKSSVSYPSHLPATGVFNPKTNQMKNSIIVLAKYCSQDLWMGKKDADLGAFFGFNIFHQGIRMILEDFKIQAATPYILAGSSAGAIGVANQIDKVIQTFGNRAKFDVLLDSGFFKNAIGVMPDGKDIPNPFLLGAQEGYGVANMVETIDPDCRKVFGEDGAYKCLVTENLFAKGVVQAPLEHIIFTHDTFVLNAILIQQKQQPTENPQEYIKKDQKGIWKGVKLKTLEAVKKVEAVRTNDAFFVVNAFQHAVLRDRSEAANTVVLKNGLTPVGLIEKMITTPGTKFEGQIDSCEAFNCGGKQQQ